MDKTEYNKKIIYLCKANNIDRAIVNRRLKKGWSLDNAIQVPAQISLKPNSKIKVFNEMECRYSFCSNGNPYFDFKCLLCDKEEYIEKYENIKNHIEEHYKLLLNDIIQQTKVPKIEIVHTNTNDRDRMMYVKKKSSLYRKAKKDPIAILNANKLYFKYRIGLYAETYLSMSDEEKKYYYLLALLDRYLKLPEKWIDNNVNVWIRKLYFTLIKNYHFSQFFLLYYPKIIPTSLVDAHYDDHYHIINAPQTYTELINIIIDNINKMAKEYALVVFTN